MNATAEAATAVSHQTIIVLDFGSQFTQLIARRLRELSVYSEILPFDTPLAEIARAAAGRRHPLGRAQERLRGRRAALRLRACSTAGVPVLGICYGMQLMTHALGGEVAPAPHREFGHATMRHRAGTRRSSTACPASLRVWASHGDFVQARAAGLRTSRRPAPTRRSRRWRTAIAGSTRCCSIPEVAHTDHGADILRNFAFDVCGCTGDWTMASFVEEAIGAHPRAGRRRPRRLRPERRRRFDGRGAAHPPGDRRSADLHLRRQRRACGSDEAAQIQHALRAAAAAAGLRRRRRGSSSTGSPASPIPETEAQDHRRRRSSTCSRSEAPKLGAFDFLGQGTLYPGRDRERLGDRAVARDQEPPQRRRPARAHALQAGRAAAAAVQGRSPRASARSSASTTSSCGGSRSRARAWRCASSARSRASRLDLLRRADAHRRRGSRSAPAGIGGCGSRSRCCCRSRASA